MNLLRHLPLPLRANNRRLVSTAIAVVGLALMLGLPSAALAQATPPAADTYDAYSTGPTTATVEGDVNPAGLATTVEVVYDTASSDWCTSFGSSGTPSFSAAGPAFSYTDNQYHDVLVDLTGLTTGTSYCAEVVATNANASTPTDDGSQASWTQGAPIAFTGSATSTGATTATVDGGINPAGQATTFKVVYDTADSDWCTSFGSSGTPSFSTDGPAFSYTDSGFHRVVADLSGLTAGTSYCAEIVATNASASTSSTDGGQTQWTQGTPSAGTFDASSTGATTATVDGSVNPAGQATTIEVVYDTADSVWCQNFGFAGSPSFSEAGPAFSYIDTGYHDVSANLTGLTAGTSYCAEIVATNGSGSTPTNDGDQVQWIQGMPSAFTFGANSTSATTATLGGGVNPAGQATTIKAVYDTAGSDWCLSNGSSGTPSFSTDGPAFSYTDSDYHRVAIDLSGLTSGTTYCGEIVATNASGSTPSNDGAQTQWLQGAASAETFDANSTSATTATVDGSVNPGGQATTLKVVYDTAGSSWCTSFGSSGTPSFSTDGPAFSYTDSSYHDVSVDLSGLTAGTTYCAEIVATNPSGSTPVNDGGLVLWAQGTPSASTDGASSTGTTTATVDGSVNPAGQATTFKVVYDTASSQWCTSFGFGGTPTFSTNGPAFSYTDSGFHRVSVDLSGLTAGTSYCAEIVATNPSGSTPTNDGNQAQWTEGTPSANTLDANSTGTTTATVDGSVNPAGQATTFKVVYDTAGSQWCQNFGFTGTPSFSTNGPAFSFTDGTAHDVSVDLSGLTPGTSYCAEIVATNAAGTTPVNDGNEVQWTEGTPTAFTADASSTGTTTATVDGSVNPAGQATTVKAVYDTASSDWCLSNGSTGTPSFSANGAAFSFTDSTSHGVSIDLSGLTASTGYCGEIVATNATGSTPSNDGNQITWTQPAATPQHTLTVIPAGSGTGTVTSNPAGINCGGTCSASFDEGTQVTLAATGSDGSTFAGWSGGGCSGTSTCVVTVNSDTTVTATFNTTPPPPHTLTVVRNTGTGSGGVTSNPNGIDCGATCSHAFDAGTQVTLTATASAGSTFTGWSGGGCSGTSTCVVTVNSDTTVTATFNTTPPPPHTLTVVRNTGTGSGGVTSNPNGIDCGATCSHAFDAGTQVTLTATASAGSTFTGWSGGGCSGTSTCVVTLNSDTTVTATFNTTPPVTHTLSVSKAGSGSGGVTSSPAGIDCGSTCSATYNAGTQVTLTATASAGSTFTGWSGGDCSGTSTCVVTLNSDTTVTATFNTIPPATHTLAVSKSGTGSGGVTSSPGGIDCGSACSAAYYAGTQVTLTATAASGSTFTGWSGGGCSGTSTCVVTLNSDTTVTATFDTTPPPGCTVPDVRGDTLAAAETAITNANCSVGTVTKTYSKKKKGTVISESPAPGTTPADGVVNLHVSKGTKPKKKKKHHH